MVCGAMCAPPLRIVASVSTKLFASRTRRETLRAFLNNAVVLDLGLPDGDGLRLIESIRRTRGGLPVLVLTARDSTKDRVKALDAGADDYLVNPLRTKSSLRAFARCRGLLGKCWARSSPPAT